MTVTILRPGWRVLTVGQPGVRISQPGGGGNGLLNNLVSYWKLDEAAGNRADSVAGVNTMVPNVALANRAGIISNAVNIDLLATNWLAVASPSTTLRIPVGTSGTVALWVLVDALPAVDSFPMARWDIAGTDWFMGISPAGVASFGVGATVTTFASTPAGAVGTGAWTFIVGWFDHTAGANGTVYVQANGGVVYSTALASAHTSTAAVRTFMGCLNAGAYGSYDGGVDEAGFWNRVLTAAQRTALYNGGLGLAYTSFTL